MLKSSQTPSALVLAKKDGSYLKSVLFGIVQQDLRNLRKKKVRIKDILV
jgi:hypothetical protein